MSAHYRGDAFKIVRGAGGSPPAERPVFVFQCYLDDSGTDGPIITLGGFVSFMSNWERVEPKLDAVMNSHGVEVFHAKQFHDTDPPFKGWSKIRKRSFAEEVFGASHHELIGISIGVRKEVIKDAKKSSPGLLDSMSPMGTCFSAIMIKLLTHPWLTTAIKQYGISFLIETGNGNNSELERNFHQLAKQPHYEGALRSISFIPKAHCRAIQLADFFVFYSRRNMRLMIERKRPLPQCPFLSIMLRHGPIFQNLASGHAVLVGRPPQNLSDLSTLAWTSVEKKP